MATNEQLEDEEKFSPWDVSDLDDFLFYCCPECEAKSSSKSMFVHHALSKHPVVSFPDILLHKL